MKKGLLFVVCVLALCLVGCTAVNQTNSFVELPSPEAVTAPGDTAAPEITAAPMDAQPTMVPLEVQPTLPPGETDATGDPSQPDEKPTWPPEATDEPTPKPESNPGGLNG